MLVKEEAAARDMGEAVQERQCRRGNAGEGMNSVPEL